MFGSKVILRPLSKCPDEFVLIPLNLARFSEEHIWAKLICNHLLLHICLVELRREECPTAIEAHICGQLLPFLVCSNSCSMDTDDVTDLLAYR